MQRFPNARAFDCFDNDLAGRIYGLRMMTLLEDIPLKISKTADSLTAELKGKSMEIDMNRPMLAQLNERLSIRYHMGQWLPPKAFKDWNDYLINKPMQPILSPRKEERGQNLAQHRNAGMKIRYIIILYICSNEKIYKQKQRQMLGCRLVVSLNDGCRNADGRILSVYEAARHFGQL